MKEFDEREPEGTFSEMADTKGNLNYELEIARQIDRVLYYRTISPNETFYDSIESLDMALVDIQGKPLRTEIDDWFKTQGNQYPTICRDKIAKAFYVNIFKQISKILSKHHMLFKSTMLEVNR